MTDIDVAALRAAAEKAHDEIVRLCSAREDWRMSIPANPERDSDLIFDAVVNQIPALLDRLAVAEAAVARVRAVAEAGDVRTLDDFEEPCVMLDDLRAAIDNEETR